MLAPEAVTFLSGGSALIVATVSSTGEPHAARGWGVTFLPGDPQEVRLLLAADDPTAIEHLTTGAKIAVTGADVETARSIQFKGIALAVEPGDDDDRARAMRFCDDFFGLVTEVDGTPRELLDHLVPADFVACRVRVTEAYDQTPGPAAGASMTAAPAGSA